MHMSGRSAGFPTSREMGRIGNVSRLWPEGDWARSIAAIRSVHLLRTIPPMPTRKFRASQWRGLLDLIANHHRRQPMLRPPAPSPSMMSTKGTHVCSGSKTVEWEFGSDVPSPPFHLSRTRAADRSYSACLSRRVALSRFALPWATNTVQQADHLGKGRCRPRQRAHDHGRLLHRPADGTSRALRLPGRSVAQNDPLHRWTSFPWLT